MHQIIAYFKFLFRSTNQHGVHSPFVYDLLTKCLYRKEKRPVFEIIENFRKALLNNHREIEVTDFGAGSRVFKSNKRKVSDIAKNAGISKKRAILLNKITSYFEIQSALELGTSVGISSAAIAAGNKVQLTTLEGCPETAAVAKEYFQRFKLDNINLEMGEFEEMAPQPPKGELKKQDLKPEQQNANHKPPNGNLQPTTENQQPATDNREPRTDNLQHTTYNLQPTTGKKFQIPNPKFQISNPEQQTTNHKSQTENHQPSTDNIQLKTYNRQPTTYNLQPSTDLIYFDGNHQKDATLKYFHQLLPLAHNDSVFIFDDIHWSKGMEEAWEEIKAHPRVRVTIDSFFWGIVFFRKEQEKEHFIIRL